MMTPIEKLKSMFQKNDDKLADKIAQRILNALMDNFLIADAENYEIIPHRNPPPPLVTLRRSDTISRPHKWDPRRNNFTQFRDAVLESKDIGYLQAGKSPHENLYDALINAPSAYQIIEDCLIFGVMVESACDNLTFLSHEKTSFTSSLNFINATTEFIFGAGNESVVHTGSKTTRRIILPADNRYSIGGYSPRELKVSLTPINQDRTKIELRRIFYAPDERYKKFSVTMMYPNEHPSSVTGKNIAYIGFNCSLWRSGFAGNEYGQLQGLFDSFSLGIRDTMKKANDTMDSVKETLSKNNLSTIFGEVIGTAGEEVKNVLKILTLAVSVGAVIHSKTTGSETSLWLGGVSSAFLLFTCRKEVYDTIMSYIASEENGKIELQGNDGITDFVYKIINSFFGSIKKTNFMKIYNSIASWDRFKSGFRGIVIMLLELVDKVANWILGYSIVPDDWYLTGNDKDVRDLFKEMDDTINELKIGKLPYTNDTYHMFKEMKTTCERLMSNRHGSLNTLLSKRVTRLEELIGDLRMKQIGVHSSRVEPTAAIFIGDAGNFKSTIMNRIGSVLGGVDEANVHVRNSANPYWDGYKGEKVCIMDDFGQTRDTVGMIESEYMTIIEAINTTPFHLNMAKLEDKADTFFRSEYVLCTTNRNVLHSEAIHCQDAIKRRFKKFYLRIIPNSGYHKENDPFQFDKTKFSINSDGIYDIPSGCYSFQFCDVNTGGSLGEPLINEVELVRKLVSDQEKNRAIHAYNLDLQTKLYQQVHSDGLDLEDLEEILDSSDTEASSSTTVEFVINDEDKTLFDKFSQSQVVVYKMSDMEPYGYNLELRIKAAVAVFLKKGKKIFKEFLNMSASAKDNFLKQCKLIYVKCDKFSLSLVSSYWEWCVKNPGLTWIPAVIGVSGYVIMLAKLYNSLALPIELQSVNANIPVKTTKVANIKPISRTDPVKPQADDQAINMYTRILNKNAYMMIMNDRKVGMITFIKDRVAILPAHYLHLWIQRAKEDSTYLDEIVSFKKCVTRNDDCEDFKRPIRDLLAMRIDCAELEVWDCIMLQFHGIGTHANILKHFKNSNEFKNYYEDCVRINTDFVRNTVTTVYAEGEVRMSKGAVMNWPNGQEVGMDWIFRMKAPNKNGDCGAWLIEMNSSLQSKKFLGFHTGGSRDQSLFVPIFRDLLERYISTIDTIEDPLANETVTLQYDDPNLDKQFEVIRKDKPVPVSGKTMIIRSKLHNQIISPLTAPAYLRPFKREGKVIDPGAKALSRYNKNQWVYVPFVDLKDLIDSEKDFYKNTRPYSPEAKIYSFDEAILGLEDDENFSSISRKSSPGYPYIFDRVAKGKKDFFGEAESFDLTTPKCEQLRSNILELVKQLTQGIRPEFVFVDCVKDETLPWSKLQEGRSRVFSACGLDMLILYRMYFGDFMRDFVFNRLRNGSAIGCNPYSEEWNIMALNLLDKNKYQNAGDFSGFDTRQSQVLLEAILYIIEDYYKESSTVEERRIRRVLWLEMYDSRHLWGGYLYKWDGSLSSGNPLTAIVNSMMHRLLMKLSFRDSIDSKNNLLFWEFNKAVYLLVLGDDGCFSVIPEYADKFNEFKVGDYLAKYGMKYTPEDKETVRTSELREITEISFLKRGWRYCKFAKRWVGHMKLESLLNQLNWTKRTEPDSITITKSHHVVRELSLHGEDVYNEYVPLIDSKLKEQLGVGLPITSFIMSLNEVTNLVHDVSRAFLQYDDTMNMYNQTNYCDTDSHSEEYGENSLNANVPDLCQEFDDDIYFPFDLQADVSATVDTIANNNNNQSDLVAEDDPNLVGNVVSTTTTTRVMRNLGDFKGAEEVDIKRYLSKPTIFYSSTFATTDTPNTAGLNTLINYGADLLSATTVKAEKIKGIYTLRSTWVITLQVNANPFQMGRYILYCMYTGGSSKTSNGYWELGHRATISQIVQLPHVEIDLTCDTSVTLKIPFKSAFNSYLTTSVTNTVPCAIGLYPYSPVEAVSGSTTVPFTLWAHHEDIELGTVGFLQADIIEREQEGMKPSTVLSTVASAVGILGRIPLLTSIATPTKWALEATAQAARAFGFNKPNLVTPPNRIVRSNHAYMGASDGTDPAEPLSLFVGNHTAVAPELFGSDIDEMSIDYLKKIPNYYGTFTWSDADAAGTQLTTIDVTPFKSRIDYLDGVLPFTGTGPLGLFTMCFGAWKGGLVYHFKIVKTKYHSGRIQVSFRPYYSPYSIPGASTMDETEYMYRNIIDVREQNEFKIHVPYVAPRAWSSTDTVNGAIGKLEVKVIDELVRPATVPSAIHIKVEFAGADDFAVAAPKQMSYVPMTPSVLQADDGAVPMKALECQFSQTKIGGEQHFTNAVESEEASMGESVRSLRSLLKRGGLMSLQQTTNDNTDATIILPFHSYHQYITGGAVTGGTLTITRDPFSWLSSIYALNRGGVRLRFITSEETNVGSYLISMNNVTNAGNLSTPINLSVESMNLTLGRSAQVGNVDFCGTNPSGNVYVPQQSLHYSRMSDVGNMYSGAGTDYSSGDEPLNQVRFKVLGGTIVPRHYIWRAGADDCSFGVFVSVPPLNVIVDT